MTVVIRSKDRVYLRHGKVFIGLPKDGGDHDIRKKRGREDPLGDRDVGG